jgi:hypothetical protein
MTQVTGPLPASAVRTLRLDFGPIRRLNFDGSGASEAFVIRQGGIGTVIPSSLTQAGDAVTVDFGAGVHAGSAPGGGQSSFFFGLASDHPPRDVTATLTDNAGNTYSIAAKGPSFPPL